MILNQSDDKKGRWRDYFFCDNHTFHSFWKNYLGSNKNLLFIIGRGFDPRMNSGIKKIINNGGQIGKCICIKLNEGDKSPSHEYRDRIDTNFQELQKLLNDKDSIELRTVDMWSDDYRHIASKNAANVILNGDLSNFSDIIVDISSLPRIIFIPIISKIISILEHYKFKTNLHIIVAENFALDEKIKSDGLIEEAIFIHGFDGYLNNQININKPRIWMPILGSGQILKLRKINDLIKPDEICPVLPFPSRNPRRCDDLVIEYKEFFSEYPGIETNNIIYVNELNPFEVYRQICHTVKQYEEAMAPLGGCNIIISPLSSKLLSIGALLAAFELKLALTEVPSLGYSIIDEDGFNSEIGKEELFELWLYGEPYEE
jgi:hypothetical protein